MQRPSHHIRTGSSPLVAVALHAGHELRPEIRSLVALDERERLLEEDPFTDGWTAVSDNRVVAHRSRFEVDLNRPRDGAVYRTRGEAWGLKVWREPLPEDIVERSLAVYDRFYSDLYRLLVRLREKHGRFIVYDLHSYNRRRGGSPDDPAHNPDINVGTGSLDRARWGPVVDRFMAAMRSAAVGGATLDVRENVRFGGGHLSHWVHEKFPSAGCALAIEVKKFFMDEHTGRLDTALWQDVRHALQGTVPEVLSVAKVAA